MTATAPTSGTSRSASQRGRNTRSRRDGAGEGPGWRSAPGRRRWKTRTCRAGWRHAAGGAQRQHGGADGAAPVRRSGKIARYEAACARVDGAARAARGGGGGEPHHRRAPLGDARPRRGRAGGGGDLRQRLFALDREDGGHPGRRARGDGRVPGAVRRRAGRGAGAGGDAESGQLGSVEHLYRGHAGPAPAHTDPAAVPDPAAGRTAASPLTLGGGSQGRVDPGAEPAASDADPFDVLASRYTLDASARGPAARHADPSAVPDPAAGAVGGGGEATLLEQLAWRLLTRGGWSVDRRQFLSGSSFDLSLSALGRETDAEAIETARVRETPGHWSMWGRGCC